MRNKCLVDRQGTHVQWLEATNLLDGPAKTEPTWTPKKGTGETQSVLAKWNFAIEPQGRLKTFEKQMFGGSPGARTLDPLIKSQMLYQLS